MVLLFGGAPVQAAIELRTLVSGLSAPLYVAHAGDGSGRLFIVEQAGRIRILSNGVLLPTPFLDIRDRVQSGGELGLLGLAFHPGYSANGRFFVNYTRNGRDGLETVIAEYAVSAQNANLASRDSEKILLTFSQPYDNHNGGMLAFGPDGFLYIGTGDGGSGGDPHGNGQSLQTLLGKILRMDVDSGNPYAVPPDNPFVGRPARGEIWAYGLRNPWRFSFDRLTGRLIAADVGQGAYEEIDVIVKGGNYGWNIMEGTHCYSPPSNCNTAGLLLPIHDYGRDLGSSVTGGYVYRGNSAPSLVGRYLYGDFGSGRLWALMELATGQWQGEQLLSTGLSISSFGVDEQGEVYLVDYNGTVRRIVETGVLRPAVNQGGVVNAASFLPGPVAPGEIISLFGTVLGPAQGAGARLDSSGRVDSFVSGTAVFFDGVPSPLFYVQSNQVNAQVPYSVAGKAGTQVQVQSQGGLADTITLPVAGAAPGLFTLSGGSGQGAIFNENSTLNSTSNRAAKGSIVVLYATGEGQTLPEGIDGKLAEAPLPAPTLPASLTIGGLPAEIVFIGGAPGFAGLLQINARVPLAAASGSAVPVLLTVGNKASQPGVTVAVE